MSLNYFKFFILLVGIIGFITVAGAFTQVVEYKPDGVPDHRRAEYDAKIALLDQVRKIREGEADAALFPVAVAKSTSYDFGMIDPHTTASHAFKISNQGSSPLSLHVAGTSCKCTVGEVNDELLLPGAETLVTLEWNTGYQADTYEQTATIVTNDPSNREIELSVQGEVRAQLIVPSSVSLIAQTLKEPAQAKMLLFSQLWDDFTIVSVETDIPDATLHWDVSPVDNDSAELADKFPKSALAINLSMPRSKFGKFAGKLVMKVLPGDGTEEITREIAVSGKVRKPISFVGPGLHSRDGLEIGSVTAGREYQYHLIVQARDSEGRELKVLDVEPKELNVTLDPLSVEGKYRLSVRIPEDCPMVVFNRDDKRGYIQVGDPKDEEYMNWFPVIGAVVKID